MGFRESLRHTTVSLYSHAMSMTPEQQRSIAELVAQVHVDNVLQVAALLRKQADDIEEAITSNSQRLQVIACGGDPISRDARDSFQRKIDAIVDVHWAHHDELRAAVDALHATARGYGFTDADIERTFQNLGTA
ncbi:hypothetical protein Ae707Ps1_1944c [Pseudonocardia sp. Ae707_Ps1]|nr:hypothetical protein Ae707Ps1_1944c [Pseudonocardia sp. Ae707_Ps1]